MGSVFRAFQEQAYHSTRCTPVYIEFEKVASGVVIHPGSKLMCILIHDIEDGSELGSLIVAEVMRTFVSDYQEQCHQAVQMDVYQDFHQKLPESLYAVQIKILQNLSNTRGIKGAVFINSDDPSNPICSLEAVDEIGIAANLSNLIEAASDLLVTKDDSIVWISLTLAKDLVFIHGFGDCYLVSVCRNNVSKQKYIRNIENAIVLLEKVTGLKHKLQGV